MKKLLSLMAVLTAISVISEIVFAATPLGFDNTTVTINAQVGVSCQEAQHGAFPSPLIIDTQVVNDQNFSPTADQMVYCTNGVVFTVNVSSANGTALDQVCTSGGVSGMLMQSASWPGDTIAYTFMCAGDTNGAGNFTGAGFTTARAMGISIKVLEADAQAAMAHADYSDTVTLTISY